MDKKGTAKNTVPFPTPGGDENKSRLTSQDKRGIIIGIITGLLVVIIGMLISNFYTLPLRVGRLETDAKELDNQIDKIESNLHNEIKEVKEDLQSDISDVQEDVSEVRDSITNLQNLLLSSVHFSPTEEVAQQISNTYGNIDGIDSNGRLSLTLTSVVAYSDNGTEFTADQLSDIKLLLPYHEGKQEVFFYGQFDEENRWDGDCLVNIYENGVLKLITDAVYENGKLLNFKQAFPDTTTGGQAVWTFSERTVQDDFSTGRTWHYFRNGNYDQNFRFDEVTAQDMISADDFRDVVGIGLEGYYRGVNSDGHFNDNTGNAYMVKYFPDGTVRTLYVGAFVNGQFEDQSGNAWMIGKNKLEEPYSYYKGAFKNGNPIKDRKYWQYDLTVEEINVILKKAGFKGDCELVWKHPSI